MLYFIQAVTGGKIRICSGASVKRSLDALQSDHAELLRVIKVIRTGHLGALEMKDRLRTPDTRNDWFEPTIELLEFIRSDGKSLIGRLAVVRRALADLPKLTHRKRPLLGRAAKSVRGRERRLTYGEVKEILRLTKVRGLKYVQIARQFDITAPTVSLIARGLAHHNLIETIWVDGKPVGKWRDG